MEENEEDIVKDEDTEAEVNDNEEQEEEGHAEIQSETKFNGRRRTTATTSSSGGSSSGSGSGHIVASAAVSGGVHTGVGQRPYQKIIVSCVGDSLTFGNDALNPLLLPPLPSTYSDPRIPTYTTPFTLDFPLLPSNHF